ncbi:hypothetical protein MBLNU459_g6298t1 [Dothideomycetes sp. NU459]
MSSSDTAPPDMNAAAKTFFSSPRFAVAGASSDPSKFGHKIFAWYLQHSLPVTPLNPSRPSVSVSSSSYPTVPDPAALANPSETGLSVITPPAVTRTLLREAKDAGVRAVFLQPGSFDDELLEEAKRLFPGAAVGGFEGGTRGGEGWCVLVDGEAGIRNAGRKESGKL